VSTVTVVSTVVSAAVVVAVPVGVVVAASVGVVVVASGVVPVVASPVSDTHTPLTSTVPAVQVGLSWLSSPQPASPKIAVATVTVVAKNACRIGSTSNVAR
jgi:hypothetical protein